MGRNVYIGVGSSRPSKKIYVGISNHSRRIIRGYIGINSLAKEFYQLYKFAQYTISETVTYEESYIDTGYEFFRDYISGDCIVYGTDYQLAIPGTMFSAYSSYTFNSKTGEYSIAGQRLSPTINSMKGGSPINGYVKFNNGTFFYMDRAYGDLRTDGYGAQYGIYLYRFGGKKYTTTSSTSQTAGTFVKYVYSTDQMEYPTNGIKGDYWYILVS